MFERFFKRGAKKSPAASPTKLPAAAAASATPRDTKVSSNARGNNAYTPPARANAKMLAVIALQSALIIALTWALVYFARDEYNAIVEREEEEIETASRVATEEGAAVVKLDAKSQQANGIETRPLAQSDFAPSTLAYGRVIDLTPLLELRLRYVAAQDEAAVVRAQLAHRQAEYQRASALFRDDRSVAQRVVQEAQAALQSEQAKLSASQRLAKDLASALRQQWGDALGAWATQATAAPLARLLNQQEVLLQLALPDGTPPATIRVVPLGTETGAQVAQLIGPAPQADAQYVGSTYFYRAPSTSLRVGAQVSAHLSDADATRAGVIIPREAVVWHGGKAWVYLRDGANEFVRHVVSAEQPLEQGWFAQSDDLRAGQQVVVSGAQLLLSEEFRYQIRNENDD